MKNASFFRKEGREILKNHWGEAVLACIIATIIPSVLAYIPVIGSILCILAEGLLVTGLIIYFIKLKNTRKSDISEIFNSMKTDTWNKIGTFIITSIFTFLWCLLFIIPGIIKAYSYAMTMYLRTKKPELTATQTITLSREIMNGKKWKLFCLQCSFIGWMLLCLLTLGLGYIILMPYIQASTIAFYEDAYIEHFGEEITTNNEETTLISETAAETTPGDTLTYCSYCGSKIQSNTKFCPDCGAKVKDIKE